LKPPGRLGIIPRLAGSLVLAAPVNIFEILKDLN
jgi:hypothetical protein